MMNIMFLCRAPKATRLYDCLNNGCEKSYTENDGFRVVFSCLISYDVLTNKSMDKTIFDLLKITRARARRIYFTRVTEGQRKNAVRTNR